MSRSFIRLRRILFCTSCMVVFGFGATQAFAARAWVTITQSCDPYNTPGDVSLEFCTEACREAGYPGGGVCPLSGWCRCYVSPIGG